MSMDGARIHTRTGRLRFPLPVAVAAGFVREFMARPVIDCGSLRSVDTYDITVCGPHGRGTPIGRCGSVKSSLRATDAPPFPSHVQVARLTRWTPYRADWITATLVAKVSYLLRCGRNATPCVGVPTLAPGVPAGYHR